MAYKGNKLSFGEFGLKALTCGWVRAQQIEAARVAISRSVKKGGKIYIRIFPDKSITKKPAEVRMGKGKGAPEGWVAVVKPGRMLFEMEGVSQEVATRALTLAGHKLCVKSKVVVREGL